MIFVYVKLPLFAVPFNIFETKKFARIKFEADKNH